MSEIRRMHLLRVATTLSFILALVNHLLPPKAFSATQLLFDYEFGLTRRGVVGEILGYLTGETVSVGEIYAATAILSLAGSIGFYLFLSRRMPEQTSSYLLMILAFNSFAFASFTGNTGYLDGLLLALESDGRSAFGLGARLLLCGFGVLVHENMLPYFTVLIGFDLWLSRREEKQAFLVALLPVGVGFLTLLILLIFGEFSPDLAAQFAAHLKEKAGFVLDPNSTDVAGRTIGHNLALMSELRGTTKYWAWVLFDGVPLLLMSLWLIWLCNRVTGTEISGVYRLALIAAILAPLSLNVIAFDVVRFGAISVLAGFLVIALLLRHLPGASGRLEETLNWPHFLVVLVLNVNMFTIQVNIGAGHTSQFPWVLLTQLKWLSP